MKGKDLFRISIVIFVITTALAGWTAVAQEQTLLSEDEFIAVLQRDATWQEKHMACRGLRQVGTEKSVPVLAALLGDEKLSHMARYAMEDMPYSSVDAALRDALTSVSGGPKIGVVTSIGARRDAQAVGLIAPLLKDPDLNLARAAAGALGRIATPESANALFSFRAGAPERLKNAVAEGLLTAGHHFVEDGRKRQAAPIYQELLASYYPEHVRMGAFRGLTEAQPAQAPDRLIAALGGTDATFRDLAAELIAEGAGPTRRYVAALKNLPAGGQASLLRGLADRGDRNARSAVVKAADSADPVVKIAAIQALGKLGNAKDVPALVDYLASNDEAISAAAKVSLGVLEDGDADSAMASAFPGAAPAAQASLLSLMTDRRSPDIVSLATTSLAATDGAVRIAAMASLADVGGKDEAAPLLAALAKISDESERAAASKALNGIAGRAKEEVLPVILEAMASASPESQIVMLRSMPPIGVGKALDTLVAALEDTNEQTSEEAIRLLSSWPNTESAPYLLEVAKRADSKWQDQALRGYVKIARDEKDAAKKTEMLAPAMGLAQRAEQKWVVLSAWGTVQTPGALDALLPHLDDPEVQNEAAVAIIDVAKPIAGQGEEAKAKAKAALGAILEKCKREGIRERAQKTLEEVG